MTPKSNLDRVEENVQAEPFVRQPHPVDQHTLNAERRSWIVDNWVLAAMIVCITVFAGVMAFYVFVPAARSVLGN